MPTKDSSKAEVKRQRNTANRLLMEMAEEMKEAMGLLRDYVRVYPNNSGRARRFLKRIEEEYRL